MSDLLSLARAVRARTGLRRDGVSSFQALADETVKQTPKGPSPQYETERETGLKQRNSYADYTTGDGDEAERAAIIEYDGCVPRELAEALARLLSSPPLAGEAPTHWRARIDQAARLCDAQAARALTSGVLANTHQGKP